MLLPLFALIDHWFAAPPSAKKVAWLGEHSYAHRGKHGEGIPENSLAAFSAATEQGLGIECDVQKSSDGEPVVFHDWELDQLTGESGEVRERTSEQLCAIALSGGTDCIASLRQVLEFIDRRVPLLIEVKSRKDMRIGNFCLAIRRVLEGYRGLHAVMSFDPRVSRWFADRSPLTVRGLVVTEGEDRSARGHLRRRLSLWHARPDFLAYDIRDLPSRFASRQRRRGLPVLTWTVRSAADRASAGQCADAPIAEGAGLGPAT